MTIEFNSKQSTMPNWISDNDWSDSSRLKWIREIMVYPLRDWSIFPYAIAGNKDLRTWAIYILATCDTKDEAINCWFS
mgnify:CR=1 FL=1